MEDNDGRHVCLLCEEKIDPDLERTIKKRAIDNLITASNKRGDGKHEKMSTMSEMIIHNSCGTTYVRGTSINKYIEQNKICRVHLKSNCVQFDIKKKLFYLW